MHKILNEILKDYKFNAYIYDATKFNEIPTLDEKEQWELFSSFEEEIKENEKNKLYSDIAKNNLFRILAYYREKYPSENNIFKINELVSSLNHTSDENYESFLCSQYAIRYLSFIKDKKVKCSFKTVEQKVISSIINDHIFLEQLLFTDDDYFIKNNVCSELSFSSLCYLLYVIPEILHNAQIYERISLFLNYNLSAINGYILYDDEKDISYTTSNKLKKDTKKLIKKINVYTRL